MRAAAEIEELALPVKRHGLVLAQPFLDVLDLVLLLHVATDLQGLVARLDNPLKRLVGLDDLLHLRFDRRENRPPKEALRGRNRSRTHPPPWGRMPAGRPWRSRMTARAITWAQECRMTASDSGSFLVSRRKRDFTVERGAGGRGQRPRRPPQPPTAALARPGPISAAMSPGSEGLFVLFGGSVGKIDLEHEITVDPEKCCHGERRRYRGPPVISPRPVARKVHHDGHFGQGRVRPERLHTIGQFPPNLGPNRLIHHETHETRHPDFLVASLGRCRQLVRRSFTFGATPDLLSSLRPR